MNYSYERVSTVNQDERRQEISLEAYHIENRYIDKLSGKNADRPQLQKLLAEVKKTIMSILNQYPDSEEMLMICGI